MAKKAAKKAIKPRPKKRAAANRAACEPEPTIDDRLAMAEEAIYDMIRNGQAHREVAAKFDCSASKMWTWLHQEKRSARTREALESSAESWLDRGLDAVERALERGGPVDASAARTYAQECARRAAIRNPRYRDKVAVGGDPDAPPIQTNTVIEFVRPRSVP